MNDKNTAPTHLNIIITLGLALTGLVVIAVSTIAWLLSGDGWLPGIGLLTGGMLLTSATALCLGQMSHTCDTLYLNLSQQRMIQTT